MSAIAFASEFPASSHDDWMKAVEAVLKGKPFTSLVSKTADGIDIQPLYARLADAKPIAGRAGGTPWTIAQRIDNPDAAAAHAQVMDDLGGGASGLVLIAKGYDNAGFGIDPADTPTILQDVRLDWIMLRLDGGVALAESFAAFAQKSGIAASSITVAFGLDPLGEAARTATFLNVDAAYTCALKLKALGFSGTTLMADGRTVHDAGGSEADELAYALASAVTYLRGLEAAGLPLDEATTQISFLLSADADQFLTMAKFRAIRLLWSRVMEACGLAPRVADIHAESAWRMMTRIDPAVNWLRTTMACFAAGLGGANHVALLPWTEAIGLADGFSRRLARNTQLMLIEESNLHRVADPAAGAGGIEALTRELCDKAWASFQALEAEGGLAAALASGSLLQKIEATNAARNKALASRKMPLTGASEFPNVAETPPSVLATAKAAEPKPRALNPIRLSQPYEALRDKAAKAAKPPTVFLANLGPIAAFNARATFAKNLFEAGGIAALGNDGFADVAAMIAAFKASSAARACLCSSDELYGQMAVEAAAALAKAGARQVWLAGRPGELEAALKQAGCTHFIYAGMDVLSALHTAHSAQGETP